MIVQEMSREKSRTRLGLIRAEDTPLRILPSPLTLQPTTEKAFYFKIFQQIRKRVFAHFGKHENSNLLFKQNEAISLVAMRNKELCIV